MKFYSKLIFAGINNANMTYKHLGCVLTVIFSLLLKVGKAQSSEMYRGYVGLSMGISFPVGDLKNHDISDGQSLFAENAFNLNLIDLSFYLSKNIGARVLWSATNFGFNRGSYEAQLEEQNVELLSMTDPNVNQRLLLVGPCYLFRFNRLELEMRVMVGRSRVVVDEYYKNFAYNSSQFSSGTSSSESTAFAYEIGSTISYFISNHISLNTRVGFVNAKHDLYPIIFEVPEVSIEDALPSSQTNVRDQKKLDISSIELGFGIGYWFAKRK